MLTSGAQYNWALDLHFLHIWGITSWYSLWWQAKESTRDEEEIMPALLHQKLREGRPLPRIFLWTLLGIFNAFLWLMLLSFHWEISLRAREVRYFGTRLFPVQPPNGVPLPVIYGVCILLSIGSIGAVLRDRNNLLARERLRTLLLQILDSLDIGIVVLDDRNVLAMANNSAHQLLPVIPATRSHLNILDVLGSQTRLREMVTSARQRQYATEVEHDLGTAGEPLPVRLTTLPLKDPQDRTTGTLLLVRDAREASRVERQMRVAERLSSLGTLAAAMAHEIRNPLEAMDLNLALLEQNLALITPAPEAATRSAKYIKILEGEISRLARIVENFLSFARPSESKASDIRLEPILRELVELLANQAKSRKVALELEVRDDPVVSGSQDQLKQAFLNLAINSLEAMPQGGALHIDAEAMPPQGAESWRRRAIIRFKDTGIGIAEDHIGRLFDPFFTTRHRGTGLGLTIARSIIHEHKGHIDVSSVPGQGSTFTIDLPLLLPDRGLAEVPHV